MLRKRYRIFVRSAVIATVIIGIKLVLHALGYEVLSIGSLHTSVVTGTFFVVGFLLSATIADYKESERIPAEFSSVVENMYEDAAGFHRNYPDFDLKLYKKRLRTIARAFASDVRDKQKHTTRLEIHRLNDMFAAMEKAGVPANFIVKLKQQQAQLLRVLFRVTYIQRITFLPSAKILAWSIIPLTLLLLLFTEVEPLFGGMIIVTIISFILAYILLLMDVISTPFQSAGHTQDDVSLFLVDETVDHLKR